MVTIEPGRRRKALLVIHGIGDQPPLRTLGAFVEGLMRASASPGAAAKGGPAGAEQAHAPDYTDPSPGSTGATAVAEHTAAPGVKVVDVAGRPRPLVRLPAGTVFEGADLDVIEYHWAEHAVGRISAAATFAWLLEVVVAGLDFRRQLPFLLAGLGGRRAWPLVLRQLLQVLGLAAAGAGLLVAALVVGARAGEALSALRAAGERLPDLPQAPTGAALVLLACLVAAVLVLARDLLLSRLEARSVARRHAAPEAWHGIYAATAERWTRPGLLALFLTLAAALGLAWLLRPTLAAYAQAFEPLLAEPGVTVGMAALLLTVVGRQLLLSHVADIALYVTSDRLSSRARTRRAILDEGEKVLRDLLEQGYEVYLAGHSLGSVVALDLLDRLARGSHRADAPDFVRVKGLLTFGSPLDKVAYFFRQRPGEGEAVRSQLLDHLHGVRRRHAGRDYGPYALAVADQPFEELHWLQVHAPADLLSDSLVHYRVDRRVVLRRFNPFTAHNSYWRDERFFAAALGWLRAERVVARADEEATGPVLLWRA